MNERMEAAKQMQDLESLTAEFSSAVRARMVSDRDTQNLFASMNLGAGNDESPQQGSSVLPSSELRRNVTRRRSSERARDSVGSTSVPVRSLVSRKPLERPNDKAYASETKAQRTPCDKSNFKGPCSDRQRIGKSDFGSEP